VIMSVKVSEKTHRLRSNGGRFRGKITPWIG
jgi:hypothetical protein